MQKLWRKTSRHRLVILFSAFAAVAYCVPLQKYFTMGRYQHYGLAIGLFGLGYLLQTIWSWKVFTHWARMAYLSTGIFSLTVGLTFFYNPWLDTKMALQTRANEHLRPVLMALYLLFSLYVGAVYARWIKEENKARNTSETAPNNGLAGIAENTLASTSVNASASTEVNAAANAPDSAAAGESAGESAKAAGNILDIASTNLLDNGSSNASTNLLDNGSSNASSHVAGGPEVGKSSQ
jgi:hypothetical protein